MEDTPRKFAQRQARAQQDRIDAIAREVKDKADKIARLQRDRLLKGVDADFPFDPDTTELSMSADEADGYNALNAKRFIAANSDWYYPTQRNLELIAGYLDRHGVVLVSATQLELVARRLDEYGLLEHRPVVEPKPEPYVNLSVERPEPPKRPEPQIGYDLKTGEERTFTAYEVEKMSADEYKRTFRLYGDRAPVFPNHPLF